MACNVFGTPVTVETLRGMPEYVDKEKITRKDLADVALSLKNAEGKDVNARSYVENMYRRFEDLHCTIVLIYNATGDLLRYVDYLDFYGFVAPAPCPMFIENGQWGAFLCVTKKKDKSEGAAGFVVYRGYKFDGSEIDYFLGWDSKVLPSRSQVFVSINPAQVYINKTVTYDELWKKVVNSGHYDYTIKDGFLSTAVIGHDKMSVLEVIHRLTLPAPIA